MENYELIKGIGLTLRVRLGRTTMLMQDINSLDVGSVIETIQRANDPLEILYKDTVVAYGEVVVVDGNFGIHLTKMNSK